MNNFISKPTKYNGFHFRSRTEARWAVFFDNMGIEYLYEHEDFILPNGRRYLPDFFLPNYNGNGMFAEVKGEFTDDDYEVCGSLTKMTDIPILLLEGVPSFKCYNFYRMNNNLRLDCTSDKCCGGWSTENCDRGIIECDAKYGRDIEMKYGIINSGNKYGYKIYENPDFVYNDLFFDKKDWDDKIFHNSIEAAKSARFEFLDTK